MCTSARDVRAERQPTAARFNSMFPFLHDSITAAAFSSVRVSRSMLQLIQRASRQLDTESVKVLPVIASLGKRLVPSATYRYDEHFDRPAHLTHAQAYAASIRQLQRNTEAAVDLIGAREYEDAAILLGKVLHAWQDLAAHSNVAFLYSASANGHPFVPDPDQVPPELRITSYDRHARDPERPGDPLDYTHAEFSLDHADKNAFAREVPAGEARSHYALAVEAATLLSRRGLDITARGVSERFSTEAWGAFLSHNASRTYGAWSSAVTMDAAGSDAGFSLGRRITSMLPVLEAHMTAFTDGDVRFGVAIDIVQGAAPIRPFATLDRSVSGHGQAWGGGVDIRVTARGWIPDIRVAGDSDRGLLTGLSARF